MKLPKLFKKKDKLPTLIECDKPTDLPAYITPALDDRITALQAQLRQQQASSGFSLAGQAQMQRGQQTPSEGLGERARLQVEKQAAQIFEFSNNSLLGDVHLRQGDPEVNNAVDEQIRKIKEMDL
jgi:hypothetical protein